VTSSRDALNRMREEMGELGSARTARSPASPTIPSAASRRSSAPPAPRPSNPVLRRSAGRTRLVFLIAVLIILGLAAIGVVLAHREGTDKAEAISAPHAISPRARMEAVVDSDHPRVEARLLGRWAPQIASLAMGRSEARSNLARYRRLHRRYDVLMVRSDEYAFISDRFYVVLVNRPYPTAHGALGWCRRAGRGPADCYAKLLTHNDSTRVTARHP